MVGKENFEKLAQMPEATEDQVREIVMPGIEYLRSLNPYLWNKGTTFPADSGTVNQMFADGKVMCFFGPAWYFNFCMGNAMDPDKGCSGDWAICEGPAAHFWGGTWLLAPAGTDNAGIVADIMNTFINNEDVCSKLVSEEAQFSNNMKVNAKFAEDPNYGSEFLGGQNDVAVFSAMTDNIKWENHTIYDQACNEGLQNKLQEYFQGLVDKDTALNNFYLDINEKYPDVITP